MKNIKMTTHLQDIVNVVYCLQISELAPEILKFEKCPRYMQTRGLMTSYMQPSVTSNM